MSRRLEMAVYEPSNWEDITLLIKLIRDFNDSNELLPIKRPPDGQSNSNWHEMIGWNDYKLWALEKWEESSQQLAKWELPKSPVNRAYLYFRVPFLEDKDTQTPSPQSRVLSVTASAYPNGFVGIGFSLTIGKRVGIQEEGISQNQVNRIAALYIKIASEIIKYLQPSYLWISEEKNEMDRPGKEDVESRSLSNIYWVNYFGPPYVDKFGKLCFLQAPGWKKEELDTGGIYLQLGAKLNDPDTGPPREEVLDYFKVVGVKHVTWPHEDLG